ncbi:peptidoglycan recognition protein family protein [Methylomarinum vadi]|uniref:peptidoglycan recognition protein family protein n=1 Tax=Methylomarinum vadi TaxID=438855 RepID=UPI0004DF8D11|nr:N-acetylmuramoyl-L-alanine amidase [Methylomarinum vadi]
MTVITGVVDRTEHTRRITISNQRSARTGELISIFDGRRTRPLAAIDSIMLHQTGFFQSARGNNIAAYDHMIAHFTVLPNGTVLQLRDLEARLNSIAKDYGLHIEFVGCFNDDSFDCARYRGYLADESSRRSRPSRCMNSVVTRSHGDVPTLEQIRAGRQLITTLVNYPS